MPQTAANVRIVPTENIAAGSARNRTSAERPMACAEPMGRSRRRVRRKTPTTRPALTAGGFAPPTSTKKKTDPRRSASRRLPSMPKKRERERHEPGLQHDVEAGDDQQMVEASPPVARHEPAVELRGPAEKERGQRTAHVALKRGCPGPRKRLEERAVGPGERRDQSGRALFDHPRALHGQPIARPRAGKLAIGSGQVLALQAAGDANPVSPLGNARDGGLSRDEQRHFGRKRPP